jgi:hypothetical protein
MCRPGGRYSGGYPGRWRRDRISALWRWQKRAERLARIIEYPAIRLAHEGTFA